MAGAEGWPDGAPNRLGAPAPLPPARVGRTRQSQQEWPSRSTLTTLSRSLRGQAAHLDERKEMPGEPPYTDYTLLSSWSCPPVQLATGGEIAPWWSTSRRSLPAVAEPSETSC